jgi:acetolactate synthase small subunit
MNHIALLMENQPGALSRVIGLFSQRGYNIDSLSVAPTQDETLSRLTMTIGEEGADINTVFKVLGDTQEIENLLSELKKEEFLEVTRSGTLGMTKGNESLATNDQTKISYD